MIFANKEYFLLLLLLIPYVLWYFLYSRKTEPTMRMSDTYNLQFAHKSWRTRLLHLPMLLRMLAFTAIVCMLARPQTHNSWGEKTVEGIDIMRAFLDHDRAGRVMGSDAAGTVLNTGLFYDLHHFFGDVMKCRDPSSRLHFKLFLHNFEFHNPFLLLAMLPRGAGHGHSFS